jgi:hypothetical protein
MRSPLPPSAARPRAPLLSTGLKKALEHREVVHVRRQQICFEEERGGSDEVVHVVDSAVSPAVLASKPARGASDLLADCDPRDGREELLEDRELVVPNARDELEPDDFARGQGLVVFDEVSQKVDGGLVASQMV